MKNRYNNILKIVLIATVAITTMSCASKRKNVKQPMEEIVVNALLDKIKENELDYEWFSARFNCDATLDKKNNTSFSGQIRMKKDSIIWVSATGPLGVEVMRFMFTPDSVYMINRLKQTYLIESMEEMVSRIGTKISFPMIQSILIGNDINYIDKIGQNTNDKKEYKSEIDGALYKLTMTHRSKHKKALKENEEEWNIITKHIWIDPTTFKIAKLNLVEFEVGERKLLLEYSKYKELDKGLCPSTIDVQLYAEKKILVNVKYNNTSTEGPLSFPFKISKKAERIY